MSKQPEEGEIWEWRAFGHISEALAASVHSHPVRMSLINIEGEDLYFIAPKSDHNIKLRKSDDRWVLKFKLPCSQIFSYGNEPDLLMHQKNIKLQK